MSIENENNNDNNFKNIIKLKQSEPLKQNGLITNSIYYIDTNDVMISLNHDACTDIIFTIDRKRWLKIMEYMMMNQRDF
jgi:hypothetical protein